MIKTTNNQKVITIMGGLPASGKSTYRKTYLNDYFPIDCDEIKKTLPNYNPENPSPSHEESKRIEKELLKTCFDFGISFVYDTTGTNYKKVQKLTDKARKLGYTVNFVYMNVSLDVALYRNAHRERKVKEEIVIEKHKQITKAMEIIKGYVDNFTMVTNE